LQDSVKLRLSKAQHCNLHGADAVVGAAEFIFPECSCSISRFQLAGA